MKIVSELTHQVFERRRQLWLETFSLPIEWKEVSEDELNNPASLLKASRFDGLLVPSTYSDLYFSSASQIPIEVKEAGMMDSLIREGQRVWLRCFLRQALRSLIFEKTPKLDTHSFVYVAGSGLLARLSAAVAVQMGFKNIVVVSTEPAEAVATFESLQKMFFQVDIKILAEAELTLQPNNGSLLLNTLTPETGGNTFDELTFLNFIKKDGLVVDLCFSEENTASSNTLIEEARHVGIHVISGPGLWGLRDYLFLKSVLGEELKISQTQYLQAWESLFQSKNQT